MRITDGVRFCSTKTNLNICIQMYVNINEENSYQINTRLVLQ